MLMASLKESMQDLAPQEGIEPTLQLPQALKGRGGGGGETITLVSMIPFSTRMQAALSQQIWYHRLQIKALSRATF